jgi:hypothetical protein
LKNREREEEKEKKKWGGSERHYIWRRVEVSKKER